MRALEPLLVLERIKNLKIADRVCIEPQVVSKKTKEYKLGIYNYDQAVKFWATPPIHGCLTPEVIFPGDMVFKFLIIYLMQRVLW